ncbi:MAG: ABC transporter substrate-binding protein [Acidiferrobacter thiooxydans]
MKRPSTLILSAMLLGIPLVSSAASLASVCNALQHKYPEFRGKTLTQALTPYTPGYESLNPKNPTQYMGFDIDLAKSIGDCLGFKIRYKPVAFDALLPTLQAGRASFVMSDIYATKERARAANFITYAKVFDGTLVAKGNPLKITGINTSLCGHTVAENTGFVEVPLVQGVAKKCVAVKKPAPRILLFDNNADCFESLLTGRANAYFNDANTINHAVAANPNKLMNAGNMRLPFYVGLAVPKDNGTMLNAFKGALTAVQKAGSEKKLLVKWGFPKTLQQTPQVIR